MKEKNRYQVAIDALEWRDIVPGGATHREAAEKFNLKNKMLINNVAHLRRVRPDLYEDVKAGIKSYNFAYHVYMAERDGK